MTRRWRWAGLTALLLVGALTLWWLKRPASPDQVAERYRHCVFAGDGGCVLKLLSPRELKDNRITPEGLTAFIKENIVPGYPDPIAGPFDKQGTVNDVINFESSIQTSKGPKRFGASIALTDEGYRVADGLAQLALTAAILAEDQPPARGSAKLRQMAAGLKTLSPDLQQAGILGFRPKPGGPFQTWEDFVAEMEIRIAKAQEMEAKMAQKP